jgi:secretion/DNA translocation related TadE-like protein
MSSSVITIGVIAGLMSISVGVVSAGAGLANRTALHGAADAAALAAADTLFGLGAGEPCSRAAEIAQFNGAQLAECDIANTAVTVRVERAILGVNVHASARAGLPE